MKEKIAFGTEEIALSFLISRLHLQIAEIPHEYNWPVAWGDNEKAIIYHWMGREAKDRLKSLLLTHSPNK